MKRFIIITAILATGLVATAQNEDDALRYSMNRYSGTARSVSLGGAMGALGGDYSSIGINPAGIAVYRSSEFTFTPSLNYSKTNSEYYKTKSDDDRLSVPFQQIGFVGTYKPIREVSKGLVSSHFSIGYNRTNSFSRKSFIQGDRINHSMLDRFTYYEDYAYSEVTDNLGLTYFDENLGTDGGYLNAFEYVNNGERKWGPSSGINQIRTINERGNAGEFTITGGFNISNKLLVGGSFGINNFVYQRDMQHFEESTGYSVEYYDYCQTEGYAGLDNYTFEEELRTTGVGVNLKVGVIYKPVNSWRMESCADSQ